MKKIEDWAKFALIVGVCLTISNCASDVDYPDGMRKVSIREDGISNYLFYNSIFGNGYVPIDREK